MNQKGNEIAIVLVAIVAIAIIGITLQNTSQVTINTEKESPEKINAEVSLAIEKGIQNAALEVMKNGYSNSTAAWYYNGLATPSEDEINSSFEEKAKENIEALLIELKEDRGYEFEIEDIILTTKVTEGEDNDSLTYSVDVLTGNPETEDAIGQVKIQKEIRLWPETGVMYNNMKEWANAEFTSEKMSTEISTLLDGLGQCQLAKCQCGEEETEAKPTYNIRDDQIEDKINLDGFEEKFQIMLEEKTASLNEKFSETGSSINCKIEGTPDVKFQKTRVQVCHGFDDETAILENKCNTQEVRASTVEGPDSLAGYIEKIVPDAQLEERDWESDFEVSPNTVGDESLEYCPLETRDEWLAVNPQLYVELTVTCENPQIIVNSGEKAEPISAKIQTIIAVQKSCAATELRNTENPDTELPLCKSGAGGGGLQCVPELCEDESDMCVTKSCPEEGKTGEEVNDEGEIVYTYEEGVIPNCVVTDEALDPNPTDDLCNDRSCNKNTGVWEDHFKICDPSISLLTCGAETTCNSNTGECEVTIGSGTNCTADPDLYEGECLKPRCNPSTFTCEKFPSQTECATGEYCNNETGVCEEFTSG